jgi:hypothetical protein
MAYPLKPLLSLTLAVAAAAAFAATASPALATSQQQGLDLTGENFQATDLPATGTSQATGTCTPLGDSAYSFHVTGVTTGPYPGTFVEDGTFTIGPVATIAVASFDSTFTITSAAGTITGTKTLATDASAASIGVCGVFTQFVPNEPDSFDIQAHLHYTAQLQTRYGCATDSGDAFVSYQDLQVREVEPLPDFSFSENFS